MKKPEHKAIIYDDSCPMCTIYTKGFVKAGIIKGCNRIAFSELNDKMISQLDAQRSRHEVPVIDLQSGQTYYGIDGLVFILEQRFPVIGKIMKVKAIHSFFRRLYAVISSNRRIIAPGTPKAGGLDVTPEFNLGYRLAFTYFAICVAVIITALFGLSTQNYLPKDSQVSGDIRMLLIAGTGWTLQILAAFLFLKGEKRITYIAHLGVIMMVGVLLLLPSIFLSRLTSYGYPLIPCLFVLCSSATMLWQHYKRAKYLKMSQFWTISWFLLLQAGAAFWMYVFYFKN